MSKKIFFTDLDGTLLNDQKEITPKTYDAVINWMNSGNYFALSSGRPLNSIKEVIALHKLQHKNLFAVGFNGALIYHPDTDTKITSKTLSVEEMHTVKSVADKHGIYCHAYDDSRILIPRDGEEIQFYTRVIHLPYEVIENFPEGIAPSNKMLCIKLNAGNLLQDLADDITKALNGSVTCVQSCEHYLEVFSNSSGKGKAVVELCKHLNIDITDSFAAGDEQNDISMIEAAGTGIAMLNGRDTVKASANVITKTSNNEDGLLPFLSI